MRCSTPCHGNVATCADTAHFSTLIESANLIKVYTLDFTRPTSHARICGTDYCCSNGIFLEILSQVMDIFGFVCIHGFVFGYAFEHSWFGIRGSALGVLGVNQVVHSVI